jgi:23S rRNA (adenine2030-N6)-methyltransferase
LPCEWIYSSLSVRGPATKGHGMHGSAMFAINPPWMLKADLELCLPWLAGVLGQDAQATWSVTAAPSR